MRLILNKGTVDGVKILKSPKLITEMTSGKSVSNAEFTEFFMESGHHFVPEGNTLAAGYGFDFVSHALWGHAYFDKGGDTVMHHTRTGFAPDAQLGVIVMTNSQMSGGGGFIIDHVRSYAMDIFLDVPKDILDLSFAKWRKDVQLRLHPQLPGIPACGLTFWDNPTILGVDASEMDALVGVYVAQDCPAYYGSISVSKTPENRLELRAGKLSYALDLVNDHGDGKGRTFLWGLGPNASLVEISKNAAGKYVASIGILFTQQ
ncbi:hypothetical protein Gpo141_00005431 [Globisporangium polare]